MKIWHLYSYKKPINGDFANDAMVKSFENGALIILKNSIITRLNKEDKQLDQLFARIREVEEIYVGIFGIWAQDERYQINKLFSEILCDSRLKSKPELFLRKPIKTDFLALRDSVYAFDESQKSTFLYFDTKSDPRLFEGQFNFAKQNGIKGVAFNIEGFSRGQLALAQKFGLETMLTGIKHARHEKIALCSGADHLVIDA